MTMAMAAVAAGLEPSGRMATGPVKSISTCGVGLEVMGDRQI